jgi:CheY-like chemotaxis protein
VSEVTTEIQGLDDSQMSFDTFTSERRAAELSPSRILLVDDDPDIRSLTRTFLEHEGYGVFSSGDAERASQIFHSVPVYAGEIRDGVGARAEGDSKWIAGADDLGRDGGQCAEAAVGAGGVEFSGEALPAARVIECSASDSGAGGGSTVERGSVGGIAQMQIKAKTKYGGLSTAQFTMRL